MNKKIYMGIVIAFLLISIFLIIFLPILRNSRNNNQDKVIDIYDGREDIVVILDSKVRNENLIDEFISKQNEQNSEDLKLDIMIDENYITLELRKNGSEDSYKEDEGNKWNYVIFKNGEKQGTFPFITYSLGKRLENVNGGEVVVSLSVKVEDLSAMYPEDICRYSKVGSTYIE